MTAATTTMMMMMLMMLMMMKNNGRGYIALTSQKVDGKKAERESRSVPVHQPVDLAPVKGRFGSRVLTEPSAVDFIFQPVSFLRALNALFLAGKFHRVRSHRP